MRVLDAGEAYRLWAPNYSDETAISFLEDKLVRRMTPRLTGLRLLDVGCGTGRRLIDADADQRVGVEPCRAMAEAGALSRVNIVEGDVRDLRLSDGSFDVVWCRLVLGHLLSIARAYEELARVADHGAVVIISDFHPAAVAAGHKRSFRSVQGELVEIEHYVHQPEDHVAAARAAGLRLIERREAEIGNGVRHFYESAGKLDAFTDHCGLPAVLALSFRRGR